MPQVQRPTEAVMPTQAEVRIAETSRNKLALHMNNHELKVMILEAGKAGEELTLPVSAVRLLMDILSMMAKGDAVTIMPVHAELTTQQAADILKVSRPYLVELLNQGKMPHHKVGTRRKVRFVDLMDFKKRIDGAREQVLDRLTREAQELGLDY